MRALLVLVLCLTGVSVQAEETATLRGRFVYGGEPPVPKVIAINKDRDVCAKAEFDQRLLVDAEDRGIANVAVWLVPAEGEKPPVHPKLEKLIATTAKMRVKDCNYQPRLLPLIAGQKLLMTNDDPVAHNFHMRLMANAGLNVVLPAKAEQEFTLEKPEATPVFCSCAIHPWMRAYSFILDHPYVAVSDAHGEFAIPDLPPGEWTFRAWHEEAGYIRAATVRDKKEEWPRGRFTVSLSPDSLGLGEVVLPAELFERLEKE